MTMVTLWLRSAGYIADRHRRLTYPDCRICGARNGPGVISAQLIMSARTKEAR